MGWSDIVSMPILRWVLLTFGWGLLGLPMLALAVSVPQFSNETASAGLQSRFEGSEDEYVVGGGVATFDCNADSLPEVFVAAGDKPAHFYRNSSAIGGPLKLTEDSSALRTDHVLGAYPLDIDADGQTDLVVLRVGEVQVFRGLGSCKFELANNLWNIHTGSQWNTAFSATWELGNRLPTLAFGSYTDLNRRNYPWGTCTPTLIFRPAPADSQYPAPLKLMPGFCALSMLFSDWGHSGHADLRIANDREYYQNGHEQLWRFQPGLSPIEFKPQDGFKPLQIWGMGIASHDLDGDTYPEIFITSMSDNKLQKLDNTNGKPGYSDLALQRGITAHRPYVGGDVRPSTAWHAQFEDVNHDGLTDLWIVKGNVSTMPDFANKDPNNLLLQQADGHFVESGEQAGINSYGRGRGGMLVDLNADGQLDMIVVNRLEPAEIWRQTSVMTGGWLQLRLQQTGSNRDAIGAWVEIDLGDRIIRREHTVGGGHASGHLGWLHFGLGLAPSVKLRVLWPNTHNGAWSDWQTVQANGFYSVDKDHTVRIRVP